MLCQDCWQRFPHICLCAKPCYANTAGRHFLTSVYLSKHAMPRLLAETSSHLFMCQTMLCQDCWQRLPHSFFVPNHAKQRLLAETSSHLFICQTMLCQDCRQTLPHICLCAKPCYANTAGRHFLTSVYVPTILCQDCWQRLPHICLCAKPCYVKTAGRDFLTSVYVQNHAMPRLVAETSLHLFMCQTKPCQDCWQRLPHICLCAKPCYAKTAGRDFLTSVYVPNHLLKTAYRDFLTSVYMPNYSMPGLPADTSSHMFMCQTMLCQYCWQTLPHICLCANHTMPRLHSPHICLCAKPCYVKTAGRDFLTSVYVQNHAMPRLLAETSLHLFMCQTKPCQDCWQIPPHICLCAKPFYAKTAGRDLLTSVYVRNHAMARLLTDTSSHLFMCQTKHCQDCWQRLPHIFLCAKPCYAKTAGRDFLTSVYVPNHF